MEHDTRNALGYRGAPRSNMGSFITKVGAIVVGGALLVGALIVSIAFFAVAVAVAIIGFGYFWWKTRAIRRQVREHLQAQARAAHGAAQPADVIEGVVVSRTEHTDETPRTQRGVVDDKSSSSRTLQ